MDDYDIPFDGMSEEDFLYRAMNEDDPMYMGDSPCVEVDETDSEDDEEEEDNDDCVAEWYDAQIDKIMQAFQDYMDDPAPNPRHYFDDIEFDPYPEN